MADSAFTPTGDQSILLSGRYRLEEPLGEDRHFRYLRGSDLTEDCRPVVVKIQRTRWGGLRQIRQDAKQYAAERDGAVESGVHQRRRYLVLFHGSHGSLSVVPWEVLSRYLRDVRSWEEARREREERERNRCGYPECRETDTEYYGMVDANGLVHYRLCRHHWEEIRWDEFSTRQKAGAMSARDWKTKPFSTSVRLPTPNRVWTAKEWAIIQLGFKPAAMEDKWFLYVDGLVLHAHRSWTGDEIFRATFGPHESGGYAIVDLVMAEPRNDDRRGHSTPAEHAQLLVGLIDTLVLLER